jgi:Ca2+-binding RTX toxin-like protein
VGRARRLSGATLGWAVLVGTVPAGASTNDVAASRAVVVTVAITVQDLAPAACAGMDLTTLVTDADRKGAKIQGTNGNDLILGTPGADRIDGRNGDDCLVGGAGADQLDGGNGFDVCLPGSDLSGATVRCEG